MQISRCMFNKNHQDNEVKRDWNTIMIILAHYFDVVQGYTVCNIILYIFFSKQRLQYNEKNLKVLQKNIKLKFRIFYALIIIIIIITPVKPLYPCEIYDEISSGVLYNRKWLKTKQFYMIKSKIYYVYSIV